MCVRTSIAFYGNFILDMDRSPGFGCTLTDLFVLFRLGFPSAPPLDGLTSPASVTRRTVLQKVRGSSYKDVPQLVNTGFQVLFHSPPGVLFTFPSRYWFTIGHSLVFSLAGWSRLIQTGFLVSRPTQVSSLSSLSFRVRGSHPLSLTFPCDSSMILCQISR